MSTLRFGEELDTSTLLKQFLGRPVSPQVLLTQIRRIAPAPQTAGNDLWPTKGWAAASPTSVGLDEQVFNALDKDFRGEKCLLMDSFVVFRCGKKVYERTYAHDYAKVYGKQEKEKGPLNQRQKGQSPEKRICRGMDAFRSGRRGSRSCRRVPHVAFEVIDLSSELPQVPV